MQRQASRPGADFELWYADAVRFDLLPVTRSMWRRRGSRLALPTPGTNVRVGVVGAIRYPNQHFLFTHQPRTITGALVLPLLSQLVARAKRTGRRIVLVIDNGRPFSAQLAQTALEEARPWVRTFELPLYTSETLNWIERFWGLLKDVTTGVEGDQNHRNHRGPGTHPVNSGRFFARADSASGAQGRSARR